MTDIVEWLRGKPMVVNESGYTGISVAGGTLLNKAADEIERLREALKECSANFVTKSSDHRIAAQEILNEFERRALVARAALNGEK